MKRIRLALYEFLRVLPLGIAAAAVPVVAAEVRAETKSPEEWACEAALRANTIEALEDFLSRYPDTSSVCGALALEALSGFAPGNDRRAEGGRGGNGNNGRYGGL